jgi:hypothetical protein
MYYSWFCNCLLMVLNQCTNNKPNNNNLLLFCCCCCLYWFINLPSSVSTVIYSRNLKFLTFIFHRDEGPNLHACLLLLSIFHVVTTAKSIRQHFCLHSSIGNLIKCTEGHLLFLCQVIVTYRRRLGHLSSKLKATIEENIMVSALYIRCYQQN